MKKVLWEEFRRTQFKAAVKADAVVIIPVAAVEQHADHLPVNTDTNICFAIAKSAAQEIEEFPVLVLPPIWMGYSPHHLKYPGTISLKYHTFVEVLTQVAASVHAGGFRKILFLNGHGGNSPIIAAMPRKLAAELEMSAVSYTYWELPSVPEQMKAISETDKGSIGHSGELETSLQLYLQSELVHLGAAEWVPGAMGDPSSGTREKGKRLFNVVVNALINVLRDYHTGKLEDRLVWRKEIPE
jgi:creatinine amidohydrolase